jgi:hypothetical protein
MRLGATASLPAGHKTVTLGALLVVLLDLLEPRAPARQSLSDPEGKGRRIVLLGDPVLLDVAIEVGKAEGGLCVIHATILSRDVS